MTHRGISSAVLIVSGHDDQTFTRAVARVEPNGVTLVVLMGIERSGVLASRLVDRGWSGGTPAAIIFDASTSRQQVWRGSLDDLAAGEAAAGSNGPGTIVVGDVAAMALMRADADRDPARVALHMEAFGNVARPV